jgi:5-methylcytosine-specific restriction endonuclease McrA
MPMDKKNYHPSWDLISKAVRLKANDKCELCHADNGENHWFTGSKVVLTVHHIDRDKKNNSRQNLIALCQRCHLRLDLEYHHKRFGINKHYWEDKVKQTKLI